MTAAGEHVTGSGQIDYVKGRSLAAQPLRVDLKFGAKGRPPSSWPALITFL